MTNSMSLELLKVYYEIAGEKVLEDVDLSLKGPALVQIIGPNGAGKTTMLRIAAGLLKPTSGLVRVCGVDAAGDPRAAGECVGYVPQRPPISKYNPMTVGDFLSTRSLFERKWPRIRAGGEYKARLQAVLGETGLQRDILGRRLWELSGGELMRVFLARTLLHDPQVFLLDEPLAPIDPHGKAEFSELLGELARERLVVVTSHDPLLLEKYTDTVVLVNRRIYAVGSPKEVLSLEVLSQVYGGALVEVERHVHIVDEHGVRRS